MPHLPVYIADRIRCAPASPYAIAQAAGVSAQCIRRLLDARPFREWMTIATALRHLGIDLVAHDGQEAVLVVDAAEGTPTAISPAAFPPPTSPDDAILGLIAWQCRLRSINANQLHQGADLPYACARRLVAGAPMRVSISMQRVLSALGIALIAIDQRGRSWPLRLHRADPDLGDRRRRVHCQRLRAWRRRQTPSVGQANGRLLIDKGHVLELYRRQRLSFAEIGRLAGVSRHRIRQIVQLFDRHQDEPQPTAHAVG